MSPHCHQDKIYLYGQNQVNYLVEPKQLRETDTINLSGLLTFLRDKGLCFTFNCAYIKYAAANSLEPELKMKPFNSHINFRHAIFSLLELRDSGHLSINYFFHIFHTSLQEKRLLAQQKTHMKTSCLKNAYCLQGVIKNIKVQIVPASIKILNLLFF